MKLKILGVIAGAGLLALQSNTASAGADVYVGLQLGPAPVYVERRPAYYHEYEPVHYHEYRTYPRTTVVYRERDVRYYERDRHDHGWHHGHHKHKHHKRRHHH